MTHEGMRKQAEILPLPDYAHVPGSNARPDLAFLETLCASAPDTTSHETAADNLAWNYGLRLFNNGFYWECHEVLETVWMNAAPNSREKHLVQAVIHLANAFLKVNMKRQNAATRLFALADEALNRAQTQETHRLMGLDLTDLRHLPEKGAGGAGNPTINPVYVL